MLPKRDARGRFACRRRTQWGLYARRRERSSSWRRLLGPSEKGSDHPAIQRIDPLPVIVVKATGEDRSLAAKVFLTNLKHRVAGHPVRIETATDERMVCPSVIVVYVREEFPLWVRDPDW